MGDHSRLTRRDLLRLAAATGAGVALGGPSTLTNGVGRAFAGAARATRTLTVGLGGDVPGLNPLAEAVATATSFYWALWDSAIDAEFDRNGRVKFVPVLLESWRVLDDKLTWEFKLRQGLKYDNGEDWDAEAFAFALEWFMNEKTATNNVKSRLQPVWDGVRIVDKYTVRVKTKRPFVLTPNVFAEFRGVPPKYFQRVGPQRYAQEPVGLGPFRFVEWVKGQRIVLERNPRYFREPVGIDRLIFRPFPEDATRVAALEAGEIDLAYNVPPEAKRRLASRGIGMPWVPVGQGMNLTMKLTIASPISDVRVRQAMNFAIDKSLLVNELLGGFGRVLRGQMASPSALGYNSNLTPYPYDLNRARRLLDEAGFKNGFDMDFDTSQGRYLKQLDISQFLAGEYRKVGINLKMQTFEWSSFIEKIYSPAAAPVFYTGSNWYPIFDSLVSLSFFHSSFRRLQYNDPVFDKMVENIQAEFDVDKRVRLMQEAHAYLREKAVVVWLFESPDVFGVGKRVKNFTPTPDNRIHFDLVELA